MVLCVTGPMAAGKNYISSLIEKMVLNGKPFVSIDADIAGHVAVDNSSGKILEAFGALAAQKGISLADENGKILRRNLGSILFENPELLKQHESIVYPEITNIIEDFINSSSDKNIIVNATVLYKIPLVKKMDAVIYVDCPWPVRLWRAKKRDGMKISQILARFKSQRCLYSAYKKTGVKIYRICNFSAENRLRSNINAILDELGHL